MSGFGISGSMAASKSVATETRENRAATNARNVSRSGGARVNVTGGAASALAAASSAIPGWLMVVAVVVLLLAALALVFK